MRFYIRGLYATEDYIEADTQDDAIMKFIYEYGDAFDDIEISEE